MDAMMRALKGPTTQGHPSHNQWDLFVLSALSSQEQTQLQEHLASCVACQGVVSTISNERDDWAESPSKSVLWQQIEAQVTQPPGLWDKLSALLRPAILAPLGALTLFVITLGTASLWFDDANTDSHNPLTRATQTPHQQTTGTHGIRKKGSGISPDFHIYLHRKGISQQLKPQDQLAGGDILGFTYHARDYRYLCVILLDHKGAISWLYPNKPAPSIEIASHGRLTGSVQLDDAPGPERLLAFFSARPLTPSEVKQLLTTPTQQSGPLSLPHQPAQAIFLQQTTLHKR